MPFDINEFGSGPAGAGDTTSPSLPATAGFDINSFGPASPVPGGAEALGRGALQGATFGLADEISGVLESLFSDKTYVQARDESRSKFKAAETSHPWLTAAGNVAGSIPQMLVPGLNVAKGASLGKAALNLGAQGALAGLGGSDASLVGPNANAAGVAGDTALGGILGAGIGAAAHGAGKLLSSAPELAKADRAAAVIEGEGVRGRATATAAKRLARDTEGVDQALTNKFTTEIDGKHKTVSLDELMRNPAKDVAPVVSERLDTIASGLDPHYKQFDEKTGGMSLLDFVNHIKQETESIAKSPLKEKQVEALNDVRDSVMRAWAPDVMDKVAANEKAAATGLLKGDVFKDIPDVKVPFQDFRAVVTELQNRGSSVINSIGNPSEAGKVKIETARTLKNFLNNRLEGIAEDDPKLRSAFDSIMSTNREISALAAIKEAVEQRVVKENAGTTSGVGHVAKLAGHGVGAAVGGMVGGPVGAGIGGLVGGAAGHSIQGGMTKARGAALRQLEHASQRLAELKEAADGGSAHAKLLLHVIENTPEIATKLASLHAGDGS